MAGSEQRRPWSLVSWLLTALAAALVAAHLVLDGNGDPPPWLLWVAIASAVAAVFAGTRGRREQ